MEIAFFEKNITRFHAFFEKNITRFYAFLWSLWLKFLKKVLATAEIIIPKKRWLLGLKFLKKVVARAEILAYLAARATLQVFAGPCTRRWVARGEWPLQAEIP